MNDPNKKNNLEKLNETLGFDPTKNSTSAAALQDALKEIQSERSVEAKAKAKELLKKAIDLSTNMSKAKREFEKAAKKFDNELGALLKTIEHMTNNSGTMVNVVETTDEE